MRRFILKELPQQKYVLLGNGFIFSAKTENPFDFIWVGGIAKAFFSQF
jgi:hypothetical protein